jgi:5'-3' exonuclease
LTKQPLDEGKIVGKDAALLSKKLATIEKDVPCLRDVSIEDLELKIDPEGRKRAYTKYEFRSLL